MTASLRPRQQLVRRNVVATTAIAVVGLVGLALLVYEIVRLNQPLADRDRWPEILDRGNAMALMTSAVVAFAARFGRLATPRLQYRARYVTRAERLPGEGRFWQVLLVNTGPGSVTVESVRLDVPAREGTTGYAANAAELRAALAAHGVHEGVDYWIVNLSPGVTLPTAETTYFECVDRLKDLDVELTLRFSSSIGDLYERRIRLTPPPDAPTEVLHVEP